MILQFWNFIVPPDFILFKWPNLSFKTCHLLRLMVMVKHNYDFFTSVFQVTNWFHPTLHKANNNEGWTWFKELWLEVLSPGLLHSWLVFRPSVISMMKDYSQVVERVLRSLLSTFTSHAWVCSALETCNNNNEFIIKIEL